MVLGRRGGDERCGPFLFQLWHFDVMDITVVIDTSIVLTIGIGFVHWTSRTSGLILRKRTIAWNKAHFPSRSNNQLKLQWYGIYCYQLTPKFWYRESERQNECQSRETRESKTAANMKRPDMKIPLYRCKQVLCFIFKTQNLIHSESRGGTKRWPAHTHTRAPVRAHNQA